MECSNCGISSSMRNVFHVISHKGIVLMCEKCASEEGYPRVKEPTEEPQAPKTVYERLSIMAGLKPKPQEKRREIRTDERSIKALVNKNYQEKILKQPSIQPRHDLVENFHWILMRVRRVRGLTQKQLAEMIGEREESIKMAEQGIVPEGYGLLDKLEGFLGVRLVKERQMYPSGNPPAQLHLVRPQPQPADKFFHRVEVTIPASVPAPAPAAPVESEPKPTEQTQLQFPRAQRAIHLDRSILNSLTIADLKRIKDEKAKAEREKSDTKPF